MRRVNATATPKPILVRLLWRLVYFLGVLLVLVLASEITARCLGYRPWQETIQTMEIKPAGRFFQEDSLLGYRGKPGPFQLLLNDSLRFTVTHDVDGWRKTSFDAVPRDSLAEIWVFGCSFTHGYGVDDAADYPARLQQLLPQYQVRNFGMDGYGTLQNWLVLSQLLAAGRRPALVVLGYGAFHDQRNTANRFWHKALHGQRIADDIRYPYMRLDENDALHIHYGKIAYHPLPLQRQLAVVSMVEDHWNRSEDQGLRSGIVTDTLIQRMADATHKAGGTFLLAGIYRHAQTTAKLEAFARKGIATVDISVDLDDPGKRILPGNGHPNAAAHAEMATKLYDHLMQGILSSTDPPTH